MRVKVNIVGLYLGWVGDLEPTFRNAKHSLLNLYIYCRLFDTCLCFLVYKACFLLKYLGGFILMNVCYEHCMSSVSHVA